MGTVGKAQGEGTPTRHREPGETGVPNSVRRPKMIAPGCPRASGPCRAGPADVSTIARPWPGVWGDPVLLTLSSSLLIDRAIRRNWVMLDSLVEKYRMTQ